MARPRKPPHVHASSMKNKHNGSSSSASSDIQENKPFNLFSMWKTIVGTVCLGTAVYIGVLGYLQTRVNTPFKDELVIKQTGLKVPDRYWGSYRPGVYFGLKSREPKSPVFGLMWYNERTLLKTGGGVRHWCEQGDNLPKYGWTRHDGINGEQTILDPPYNLTTSFLKEPSETNGGHWTARVTIEPMGKANRTLSIVWYAALDDLLGEDSKFHHLSLDGAEIAGYTPAIGTFRVQMAPLQGEVVHLSGTSMKADGHHRLKEEVLQAMRVAGDHVVLQTNTEVRDPNMVAIQMVVRPPFTLDIVYRAGTVTSNLVGHQYSETLAKWRDEYDATFHSTFNLKGYTEKQQGLAREAVSALIGGTGYFYGASKVQSPRTPDPVPYWRAPLYTAVPSRSFFPRGFLWDEGFHSLLTSRWSLDMFVDIVGHWLDLMNVEGWIPREQILGSEAVARVPAEFIVQNNAAANPPVLLIALASSVRRRPDAFKPSGPHSHSLQRMWPRLEAWFLWLNTTQRGVEPTTYRWRLRDSETNRELNPKTLTSGLDDYPRASHPSEMERHVDLRCWMFAAASAMADIANTLDVDGYKYEATRDLLGDEELLNKLHWSSESGTYADYGYHTDGVRLIKARHPHPARREVTSAPHHTLVTSAYGYVSLFPMLLKVLRPDSPRLGTTIEKLTDPDHLFSPYGLRSLSKSSPLYNARNTEVDPPYWRGPVWMNLNYLALASLKHYATVQGPYAEKAADAYAKLRDNVVGNILKEYERTGYLWEQYSDVTGRGQGCRPFNGWTSLVALVMAEEY